MERDLFIEREEGPEIVGGTKKSKENVEFSISNDTMRLVGFVKKDAYDEVNEALLSLSEKYHILRTFFPQQLKAKEVDESIIKKIERFERLAEEHVWG